MFVAMLEDSSLEQRNLSSLRSGIMDFGFRPAGNWCGAIERPLRRSR
jgi:hypothetical protein